MNQIDHNLPMPAHCLILGGQKSGKSRHAEAMAVRWLSQPGREAVLIATAQAWDEEMQERIARHRADRAVYASGLQTVEEPLQLAQAIRRCSAPQRLLVVDCLTLWLTNYAMPIDVADADEATGLRARRAEFQAAKLELLAALQSAQGPVLLVSNEMGWGVMPMGRAVRAFADELGLLNQAIAAVCQQVLMVVAGQAVDVKALAHNAVHVGNDQGPQPGAH
ncbi:bifunctional adenosylcobinamide kinase/adenosylcobinamide-phosphate guanylyltransferase [Lampropedia aestuarii]|uniref:bifunctional adenosylcobinamide kinase/adenosylcobinamide-phosphate guanylyltransferase n=1 Tax=Lampropedia aestuarii TaxID=2562762 RepID=UPI0024686EF6|nr:bifunctional adenosylcobinamide kinase/adenosylcobinamide-phosphate guanylyltransferase [Lampropedia aestuarii]MDH5857017.1 bifunctional adenosylcobinamide kinase/adenosylcobinamide-phosphate guanylyltransferase [Lampropedia aestuarii]